MQFKICEILGLDVNEKFKIDDKGYVNIIFYIDSKGHIVSGTGIRFDEIVVHIINGECNIIKTAPYKYNEDEIITLKALWINGYRYITRDRNRDLCAWDDLPNQGTFEYDYGSANILADLDKDLFKNIEFGNFFDISFELVKIS